VQLASDKGTNAWTWEEWSYEETQPFLNLRVRSLGLRCIAEHSDLAEDPMSITAPPFSLSTSLGRSPASEGSEQPVSKKAKLG